MNHHIKRWPFITSLLLLVGAASLGFISDFFIISLTWLLIAALCMAGILVWCGVAFATMGLIFTDFWKPEQRTSTFISAICLVGALAIAPLIFHACVRADLFFHHNRARFEEAATMAINGKLEQNGRDFKLPPNYSGLSATHSVWLYRRDGATDVMFITAGWAGEVSGYVYSSDGQTPLPGAASRPIFGGGKQWYRGSNDGCGTAEEH